jgi:hypothetical protein
VVLRLGRYSGPAGKGGGSYSARTSRGCIRLSERSVCDRGASLIRNRHPPGDHCRSLGIGLLQGPRGGGGSYVRGTPVLPSNQRQRRTLHAQKDVLPWMHSAL